ncbi:hypothetical protein ACH4N4_30335 [Streptomyces microflavus]
MIKVDGELMITLGGASKIISIWRSGTLALGGARDSGGLLIKL